MFLVMCVYLVYLKKKNKFKGKIIIFDCLLKDVLLVMFLKLYCSLTLVLLSWGKSMFLVH